MESRQSSGGLRVHVSQASRSSTSGNVVPLLCCSVYIRTSRLMNTDRKLFIESIFEIDFETRFAIRRHRRKVDHYHYRPMVLS